jgi:hypothetical protein
LNRLAWRKFSIDEKHVKAAKKAALPFRNHKLTRGETMRSPSPANADEKRQQNAGTGIALRVAVVALVFA